MNSSWRSYLDCPIIAASANELRAPPGWVAGVDERGVALQTLDPLTSFTVPHTHSLVCARGKQHAEGHSNKTQLFNLFLDTFIYLVD